MRLPALISRAVIAGTVLQVAAVAMCAVGPAAAQTPMPANAPRHFDAGEAIARDPATPTAAADEVLTLHRDSVDRMTVQVELGTVAGTHSRFSFLVDTGAERTVIAHTVANALGLVPSGRGLLVGMAGVREVDPARAPQSIQRLLAGA